MYLNHVKLSDLKSIKSFLEKSEKFLFKNKESDKERESYNNYNPTIKTRKSTEIKVNSLYKPNLKSLILFRDT